MKPLKITVVRRWFTPNESLGQWYFGDNYLTGKAFCYTLEDEIRPPGEKVADETAIPYGTYKVEMTFSPKFGKVMPLIADVPGFTGIRIHSGNNEDDTSGCLLIGFGKGADGKTITQSRDAFTEIYAILEQATREGRPIEITFLHT